MKEMFLHQYSRALRLWHWSTLIVTLLLLYSVFVGKFFLNPFSTTPTIQESLHQSGIQNNTPDVSFHIAEALSKHVWDWHVRYSYVLTGLFVFRILLEFFQPGQQKFFYRIKNALLFVRKKEERKTAVHYLMVKFIYLLFYLVMTTIIGTGLWLSFNRSSINVEQIHSVKELHQTCFMLLLVFILVHLIGVILAERKGSRNIVSAMIHGGREKN